MTARAVRIEPAQAKPPQVTAVYPSAPVLPENQLKFYVHFSQPMQQGGSYRHVVLMDASGKPVSDPFLELGEELWDRSGRRFTLLIDPGRIKRGLKPREDVGPVLEADKSYRLSIRADWKDAAGRPLQSAFVKAFRVGPPDMSQPTIDSWRVTAPAAGGRTQLRVDFPEPLDHAMLERVVSVVRNGEPVDGEILIEQQESRWSFRPQRAWIAGDYDLKVEGTLEDLAGNSLAKPFEVPEADPGRPDAAVFRRSFQVR